MASLDCDDKNYTREQLERMTYVVRSSDGAIVKRIVIVEAEDPIECDDAHLGNDVLYRKSLEKLGDRMFAERVIVIP